MPSLVTATILFAALGKAVALDRGVDSPVRRQRDKISASAGVSQRTTFKQDVHQERAQVKHHSLATSDLNSRLGEGATKAAGSGAAKTHTLIFAHTGTMNWPGNWGEAGSHSQQLQQSMQESGGHLPASGSAYSMYVEFKLDEIDGTPYGGGQACGSPSPGAAGYWTGKHQPLLGWGTFRHWDYEAGDNYFNMFQLQSGGRGEKWFDFQWQKPTWTNMFIQKDNIAYCDGQWHSMLTTFDGTTRKLWYDPQGDQPDLQDTPTSTYDVGSNPRLFAGCIWCGGGGEFSAPGKLRNIKIYDNAVLPSGLADI